MYLSAHRVRRITGKRANVGINTFLYQHDAHEIPEEIGKDKGIIELIANENPGKLIAESVDIVPGNNAVLSYVDIVGREGLDKVSIREFLHQKEQDVDRHFKETQVPFTDSVHDIVIKFGISYGLRGQEVREYKALAERAIGLFESREPPRWRTETPWIVIEREMCDDQERFSLATETAERLREIHEENWASSRISIDRQTKCNFEFTHSDLIQHVAPILTELTLEQIAAQGGMILHDPSIEKKIKWPELTEI